MCYTFIQKYSFIIYLYIHSFSSQSFVKKKNYSLYIHSLAPHQLFISIHSNFHWSHITFCLVLQNITFISFIYKHLFHLIHSFIPFVSNVFCISSFPLYEVLIASHWSHTNKIIHFKKKILSFVSHSCIYYSLSFIHFSLFIFASFLLYPFYFTYYFYQKKLQKQNY